MTKTCTKCGERKPLDCFGRDSKTPDKLNYRCKSCNTIAALDWAKANQEKRSSYMGQWRANNQARVAVYKADYMKQWRTGNKQRVQATNSKRKARKKTAQPAWLNEQQLNEIAELYEVCAAFRLYTGEDYHVDHIVPLVGKTVCGLHVPWNLQVLHWLDNMRKGNKL